MEFIEHKASSRTTGFIKKAGTLGPLPGALVGAIPQCGFSAAAANLYTGRVITLGTLVAVFLSTSDEMLPILISGGFSVIVSLLFLKSELFTSHFRNSENNLVLLSAFFALLIFLGVVQCINSRTDRLNIFSGISKNPTFVLILLLISAIQISLVYFGGEALRATPLYPNELLFTLLVSLCAIPIELLRKMLWRFSGHTTGF
jgi:hypothetical protein